MIETLTDPDDEVDLLIGAVTESVEAYVSDAVPRAKTLISGLGWLHGEADDQSGLAIGRLLLVDRSAILVSTFHPDSETDHAVFASGFRNGLVVISRRLTAQGLILARDPQQE